jgi:hypothetical protein
MKRPSACAQTSSAELSACFSQAETAPGEPRTAPPALPYRVADEGQRLEPPRDGKAGAVERLGPLDEPRRLGEQRAEREHHRREHEHGDEGGKRQRRQPRRSRRPDAPGEQAV